MLTNFFGLYRYNPLVTSVMARVQSVSAGCGVFKFSCPGSTRGYLTLAQAWARVDWGRQSQYPYVVIDPLTPSALQYLDKTGYLALQRVCLSKDKELLVVATPESAPPKKDKDGKLLSPNPFEGSNSPFRPLKGWMMARVRHANYFKSMIVPAKYRDKSGKWKPVSEKNAFVFLREGMVKPTERNLGWLFHKWGSQLYFWMGYNRRTSKLTVIGQFAKSLTHLLSKEGSARLTVRLKTYLFVVNSYLAGNPVKDTRNITGMPVSIKNGLPGQLPVSVRSALRRKSLRSIRVWASLLNAYKAFSAPYGELDYSKIQSPLPKLEFTKVLKDFLPIFWGFLTWSTEQKTFSLWSTAKTYLSVSAGPNHKIALFGAALDARYWCLRPKAAIWEFIRLTGRTDLEMMMKLLNKNLLAQETFTSSKDEIDARSKSGKLSVKEEAAGKLRIFAIVDYWTQTLCEPLHKWIFSLLKTIPTDGTFNQEGAIKSFMEQEKGFGNEEFYCYDLTSATDMISREIYEIVFGHVLGPRVAKSWMRLLTDREFARPSGYPVGDAIRYTRGQPMGALSSWGALAVVHHFVVQFAAQRAGMKIPCTRYRVVGDDLVIAGAKLAESYISVTTELDIPLNLKKSFTSTIGFFNFCQQSILAGDNISPVSLKEELQVVGAPSRLEMAHRMLRRGWAMPRKLGSALRLLFLPSDWNRQWASASKTGDLGPHIARAVRLLLGPNPSILKELGVQTGAFQAWFLSVNSGGGLLAPYSNLSRGDYRVPDALGARFIYELANSLLSSIEQKQAANLASMKVFNGWVSANSLVHYKIRSDASNWIKFQVDLSALTSTIMTYRDTAAYEKAGAILLESRKLKDLCRVGPIAQREAALARLYRLESEFPTLPDFRLPEVMMVEARRRYVDRDLVDDAALIEFATRIAQVAKD